ncbi:hypothetical protein EDD17DRAFT_1502575 [Pisolithus thermaeus]|nr:hypothetical protein EV401DRAFT_1881929 [Pisolithus croceorrhizus]KAI6169616.1 hypothetical protein EDD17DRAFT_1502575 [Pisolithus thermaeus]
MAERSKALESVAIANRRRSLKRINCLPTAREQSVATRCTTSRYAPSFTPKGALFAEHEKGEKIGSGVSPPVPRKSFPPFYGVQRNGIDKFPSYSFNWRPVITATRMEFLSSRPISLRDVVLWTRLPTRSLTSTVEGACVTPGVVDVHSHYGVTPSPILSDADDANSPKGMIEPRLQFLDGLNTHDDACHLSVAGGVTISLVLPSSANAIGVLAVSSERIPYDKVRQLKEKQDEYCAKVLNGTAEEELGAFPEDLQYGAVVDTLRGKVKLTNEFKFPVAAFHHAHEAYFVPGLLKKSCSPFLTATSLPLLMTRSSVKGIAIQHAHPASYTSRWKSDTPAAVASRWLLHDAQQAYYYGLAVNAAMASVTTTAANLLGLDYRLDYIKEDYDAVTYEGLPPLYPKEAATAVVFRNVSSIWLRDYSGGKLIYGASAAGYEGVPVFDGTIVCVGSGNECYPNNYAGYHIKDLQDDSIMPALTSIPLERTTSGGPVDDPLLGLFPGILTGGIVSAYDGLVSRTRDATPVSGDGLNVGFFQGISTSLFLGAKHKLEKGAVVKRDAASLVGILQRGTGVNARTQIAILHNLLLSHDNSPRGQMFQAVHNRLTYLTEVANANVGVIITPVRSFPFYWEGRCAHPGPPLTKDNVLTTLIKNNVTVGIGHQGAKEVVMLPAGRHRIMRRDTA